MDDLLRTVADIATDHIDGLSDRSVVSSEPVLDPIGPSGGPDRLPSR